MTIRGEAPGIASAFDTKIQDGYTYISKRMEFDAGHRLSLHGGKCANLHGHRYVIELGVTGPLEDGTGMIADYSLIKGFLKGVIAEWDHMFLINEMDPHFQSLAGLPGVIPVPWEPTAENMARYIFGKATAFFDDPIKVRGVTVWETPTCRAVVRAR